MKQKSWISIVFSFASQCRIKIFLSVLCAVISVVAGLIPLLECLSDYIPLYRRFSCDGRGLEVVLDWTCRIRIAFPVLRDFNQPVPLLGIYNSGEYTAQSCKKIDERHLLALCWGNLLVN